MGDSQLINYEVKLQRIRRRILFTVLMMSFFGILLVYDASSAYAWQNFHDAMFFLKRQAVFVLIGILFLLGLLKVNLYYVEKYSQVFLLVGILLIGGVLFFGVTSGGAKRWFRFGPIGFQPSELMKVFFIIYLSGYFTRKKNKIADLKKGVLPVLIITGLISLLIFLEPDFGTGVLFGLILFLFLFIAKVSKKYLGVIILVAVVLFSVLILSSPYRRERVFAYLNPQQTSQGSGFQLLQSQIGIGSGGLWGVGLGESKQKLFFLPAAHTDFIFSIVGEEFGFLGSCFIIFLYLYLFFYGIRALKWIKDPFKFYLAWSCIMIIVVQALVNIAVAIGILPTKGFPLPFLSYGGSSTVVSFMLIGLFLNATRLE